MRLPIILRFPEDVSNVTEPSVRDLGDSLIERRLIKVNGSLAGKRIDFVGLQATITDVLVRVRLLDGSESTSLVHPSNAWIEVTGSRALASVAGSYTLLGIEHITFGIDHLLFVLALLIITNGTADRVHRAGADATRRADHHDRPVARGPGPPECIPAARRCGAAGRRRWIQRMASVPRPNRSAASGSQVGAGHAYAESAPTAQPVAARAFAQHRAAAREKADEVGHVAAAHQQAAAVGRDPTRSATQRTVCASISDATGESSHPPTLGFTAAASRSASMPIGAADEVMYPMNRGWPLNSE